MNPFDNEISVFHCFVFAYLVAARVTSAIRDAVGDTSPDITVTHQQGEVSLGGWARNSVEVDKAVAVASNVSGVKQVYANGVRLWSTNNYGQ